ncbi:MAG: exonuclease domain-containing protein [Ilumatobacteraceae bacterium]
MDDEQSRTDNELSASALSDVTFAVVDVETTGFDPDNERILQVAAVVVDGQGNLVETFDTVVRPENPEEYRHGAEHIHGISEDDVAHGMPLRQALEKVWGMSEGRLFTAHNARFDIGFLHAESARVGIEKRVDRYVDTLELARMADRERTRKHTLSALCDHYGIEIGRAHEALADATATARLLFRLLDDVGVESADQLPELGSP